MNRPDVPPPCVICGKKLEPAFPISPDTQPSNGLTFIARGNYGSTVYDPVGSHEFLELTICDDCLRERKNRIFLVHTIPQTPLYNYEEWEPDADYN